MGFGLSRKIKSVRNSLFLYLKEIAPKLHNLILIFSTRCKFIYKINKGISYAR